LGHSQYKSHALYIQEFQFISANSFDTHTNHNRLKFWHLPFTSISVSQSHVLYKALHLSVSVFNLSVVTMLGKLLSGKYFPNFQRTRQKAIISIWTSNTICAHLHRKYFKQLKWCYTSVSLLAFQRHSLPQLCFKFLYSYQTYIFHPFLLSFIG